MPLPKSMIEAELPARAQQGDENALAALIARMMPAIRKGAADCTAPGLDFEDAVQYYAARQADADYIITRNKKDFSFSEIEVLTSEEYVLLKHII